MRRITCYYLLISEIPILFCIKKDYMEIKLTLMQRFNLGWHLPSPIETKLPSELLQKVFSFLPNHCLTNTYCVNKRWNTNTLDPIRRREANLFKSFIRFIADNIPEEKNAKTKEKIENLIPEIKLSQDVVISLLQLKTTLLDSSKQLITLLKELDSDKQQALRVLTENVPKPLHLNSTFDFADHYRRVRNLFRIINMRNELANLRIYIPLRRPPPIQYRAVQPLPPLIARAFHPQEVRREMDQAVENVIAQVFPHLDVEEVD